VEAKTTSFHCSDRHTQPSLPYLSQHKSREKAFKEGIKGSESRAKLKKTVTMTDFSPKLLFPAFILNHSDIQ